MTLTSGRSGNRVGLGRTKGCVPGFSTMMYSPYIFLVHRKALGTPILKPIWSPDWSYPDWQLTALVWQPVVAWDKCPAWCTYSSWWTCQWTCLTRSEASFLATAEPLLVSPASQTSSRRKVFVGLQWHPLQCRFWTVCRSCSHLCSSSMACLLYQQTVSQSFVLDTLA